MNSNDGSRRCARGWFAAEVPYFPVTAVRAIGTLLAMVTLWLGATHNAHAAITAFWSAGNTCTGAATANFIAGGPNIQVSLCVSTTAEGVCGASLFPKIGSALHNGHFQINGRTLGAAIPDPSSPIAYPVNINVVPDYNLNFGGSRSSPTAPAAAANTLLATFDLVPLSIATQASYVLSLDGFSEVNTALPGANCFTDFVSDVINPSIVLNGTAPPAITSPNSATFTVTFPGSFTVGATGAPDPTLSMSGILPPGVAFTPASKLLGGTPALGSVGSYPVSITAANGNLPDAVQNFTLVVQKANQPLGFPAQTIPSRPFVAAGNFVINPLASGGGSTSPVTYSSATGVCTVSGNTVTIVTAGTCTLIADQASDANFNAANSATQTVTITAIAPGAPIIGTAAPGDSQATIAFSPPLSDGGAPISSYTASCNGGIPGTGANSPLTVTGLVNGNTYACSVTATNAAALTGPASGTVNVTLAYVVTPMAGPNGTISPSVPQTIAHGSTASFTVAPDAGYSALVSGCGGSLIGSTYTTGPITAPCTVAATFVLNSYSVTPSAGANGSISPSVPQSIGHGTTTSFTVTPNPGYVATVGGTCGGSLVGNTYTTNAVTGNCTVVASFAPSVNLVSVVSRKFHGGPTAHEVGLVSGIPISGNVSVEPRSIGAGHLIVFVFDGVVNDPGTVSVTDVQALPIGMASVAAVGSEVRVTLTGIPDNTRVTLLLSGVNGGISAGVSLGFLVGDVSNSRAVNAIDISAVKAHASQTTDATNFRFDLNASGSITQQDISAVKARSGWVLP